MLANAQKKTQQKGLLSLKLLWEARQQQQQPNTYVFFQKEATESWFGNKWEVVFFFLFPHLSEKKGLKRQIVFVC